MNGEGNGNGGPGGDTSSGGKFENKVIRKAIRILRKNGYRFNKTGVKNVHTVMLGEKHVATICRERAFPKYLKCKKIDCRKLLGKEYWPDAVVIHEEQRMLYIIEAKSQTQGGSVDEKLQTCDFKKRQFKVLAKHLQMRNAEYIYVLEEAWFRNKTFYDEVFKYIKWVGCDYHFDEIPLAQMGLYDTQPDS